MHNHIITVLGLNFHKSDIILFLLATFITILIALLQSDVFRSVLRGAVSTPIYVIRVSRVRQLRREIFLLRSVHRDGSSSPLLGAYFSLFEILGAIRYSIIAAIFGFSAIYLLSLFAVGSFSAEAQTLITLVSSSQSSKAHAGHDPSSILTSIIVMFFGMLSGLVFINLFKGVSCAKRGLDFLDGRRAIEKKERAIRAIFAKRRARSRWQRFKQMLPRSPRL